ncbi:MAG: hypothetical protein KF796_20975 [Ramlibacter sp.]|nr:hypothetical protein [Ramlibacter sp.]
MHADKLLVRGTEVRREDLPSLEQWFPVTIDAQTLSVWWRHVGVRPFTEPFFHDTLTSQPSADRRICQTPLAELGDGFDCVAPTAFVFHVSRCGSTLLMQMLAARTDAIVMSEPPVLDAFFRLHHHQPEQSGGLVTLRRLVAALGQRRTGRERHLFVKLDSWHAPWMPLLREAYPETPFVFLYREPDEVLASHGRSRGPQMVPGFVDMSRLKVDAGGLAPGDLDAYSARVLSAIFAAALEAVPVARPILLNYRQLPQVVWSELLPGLSVHLAPEELGALKARSAFHAKHSTAVFTGDGAPTSAGRAGAPDVALAVRGYEKVEALRTSTAARVT